MTWKKPETSYWNNKFAAWWHDPIDKVFNIQKHEEWAAEYMQVFGMDRPNDEFWKKADAIAAGFERGQIPSYSADEKKNGAVNFIDQPVITHPTSGKHGRLNITGIDKKPETIHTDVLEFLRKTIGMSASHGDYAGKFENDEHRFAIARLLYTHLVLRFALAEQNIGGLGALWHRIPADSRFPDHSIWQHNALCSAISSCIELSGQPEDVGLMVFSITPVQGFIAKSRKLRDFWVGSVLLSWLAFEGLRWIMENLGADHVLYPSLIDQPLVNTYLEKEWRVSGAFKPEIWSGQPNGIASLPNKFLFLVPLKKAEIIAEEIEKAIADQWNQLALVTLEGLSEDKKLSEGERACLSSMFTRQTQRFWDFQWSAARLATMDDKDEISSLLNETLWKNQFSYLDAIRAILEEKGYSLKDSSRGILYSTSHHLAQSALAAEKTRRQVRHAEEPGEKCQMCGEFEVLHDVPWQGGKAGEYKEQINKYWNRFSNEDDFKENEHLCAVCFIKRYVPRILKKDKTHILNSIFSDVDSFPSTTMMALSDYFHRNDITDQAERKKIADNLHNSKTDETKVKGKESMRNADKYFAILLMDGDHMGKLINGESIAATWEKIMHPQIVDRLESVDYDPLYGKIWKKIYGNSDLNKRLVTPAIHAAISEALGDFSLYGVAPIIEKYEGRLIYAGGDDVCAFMPIRNALDAAKEIKDYYASVFRLIGKARKSSAIEKEWCPAAGKLSVNLGIGSDISISAAILICHHKESLTQMMERAHQLLKTEAKEKAGRNACAIELRKRHGGSRYFTRKWLDVDSWDAFAKMMDQSGTQTRQVSQSLIYRFETLRPGVEAIINFQPENGVMLEKFVSKQIERSGPQTKENHDQIAKAVAGVVCDKTNKEKPFNPEGLMIAGFLSGGGES